MNEAKKQSLLAEVNNNNTHNSAVYLLSERILA